MYTLDPNPLTGLGGTPALLAGTLDPNPNLKHRPLPAPVIYLAFSVIIALMEYKVPVGNRRNPQARKPCISKPTLL